ncbi:STAS domain-containing protein [Fulvimarina manganoxydans]|uniref:STAS domain-containing protein n=1 Tax=Fulvimarina manganoxydans TaxID=937218 RepID=A0A1W2ETY6_9HYPH|nr:STAS domain-containing protein [Fulvimarina manganoxydans]SMD13042.1 STAS domain-containing protein [Fulvimarina manganoxydans]
MDEHYQTDMNHADAGSSSVILLETAYDLRSSDALAQTLRDHLGRGDVTIDASGLQSADITALQLLLSARNAAASAGTAFTITGWETSGLPAAAERAGLAKAFEPWMRPLGA